MMQDTVTYECQECHQELTFYQKTSDGYNCPICNGSNLLMVGKNKYRNREKVLETRKLYEEQLRKECEIKKMEERKDCKIIIKTHIPITNEKLIKIRDGVRDFVNGESTIFVLEKDTSIIVVDKDNNVIMNM